MSKYIDAERLKQILKPKEWGTPDERWIPEHEIGAMLDYFPAADVVEVVRCRDCKWFDDIGCAIRIVDDSDRPSENDFCSFAERKDNG